MPQVAIEEKTCCLFLGTPLENYDDDYFLLGVQFSIISQRTSSVYSCLELRSYIFTQVFLASSCSLDILEIPAERAKNTQSKQSSESLIFNSK